MNLKVHQVHLELRLLRSALFEILLTLDGVMEKVNNMAKTNSEFQAILVKEIGEVRAAATAQTSVILAIKGLLEGNAALVAALKAQVAELLANNGVDDAVVAQIIEAFDSTEGVITTNTQSLVEAGVVNTPAAN